MKTFQNCCSWRGEKRIEWCKGEALFSANKAFSRNFQYRKEVSTTSSSPAALKITRGMRMASHATKCFIRVMNILPEILVGRRVQEMYKGNAEISI